FLFVISVYAPIGGVAGDIEGFGVGILIIIDAFGFECDDEAIRVDADGGQGAVAPATVIVMEGIVVFALGGLPGALFAGDLAFADIRIKDGVLRKSGGGYQYSDCGMDKCLHVRKVIKNSY